MNINLLSIVVLNYINYEDTIECVDSILNDKNDNIKVIIVENGSPNNSFEILNKKYENNSFVIVLKNELNLGFSRGNNVGIDFARNVLKSDYVFVLNSDTLIQKGFFSSIFNLELDPNFGVFSPTVIDENGIKQIPTLKLNDIRLFTIKAIFNLMLAIILHLPLIHKLYFILRKNNKKENYTSISNYENLDFNFTLNGSAFFLTPTFFKYYNRPYPKTFLYWEEINLVWYLHKVNLRSKVFDTVGVIHKESQSISKVVKREKMNFWKLKKSFKSLINSIPLFVSNYKSIKKYD